MHCRHRGGHIEYLLSSGIFLPPPLIFLFLGEVKWGKFEDVSYVSINNLFVYITIKLQ